LLGVTGGIAAYKAPELVRRLVERGCEVQVVMTHGAREFVGALTFQAVSGRRVRDDLWDPCGSHGATLAGPTSCRAHDRASWARSRPAWAATCSLRCLATTAPIVLAPAMRSGMWANPAVQANRGLLERAASDS
jgi:phosphopantothenoylcysteine decarboxylase/phosphopantothenate--cysteine ligase